MVLRTDARAAVGFSLGIVELVPRSHEHEVVGHLGPDLLGADWDEAEALRRLRSDPDPPGGGGAARPDATWPASATCTWPSSASPAGCTRCGPSGRSTDLERLVRRARQMLDLNKERAIQSTTGDLRPRERMWVYRRDNAPCRRCGTPVRVAMRGPAERERASYWCPRCQPED